MNLSKQSYVKGFKSYEEQVELLTARGLKTKDKDDAARFLSYVNYYRFIGYAFIFKDSTTEKYRSDVSFEDVVALYRFDRALRSLVADAIARIEVYARTKIAYFIGKEYGPFGHADRANFSARREATSKKNGATDTPEKTDYAKWIKQVRKDAKISAGRAKPFGNASIQHFQKNYNEWPDVPIWTLTEIISFGSLKTLLSVMKSNAQKSIAHEFGLLSKQVFLSWFGTLNATRNVCAHFERLWNRPLQTAPQLPHDKKWDFLRNMSRDTRPKIFTIFTIIDYVLDVIQEKTSEPSDWHERFRTLMNARQQGDVFNDAFYEKQTGFISDWEEHWATLKPSA